MKYRPPNTAGLKAQYRGLMDYKKSHSSRMYQKGTQHNNCTLKATLAMVAILKAAEHVNLDYVGITGALQGVYFPFSQFTD